MGWPVYAAYGLYLGLRYAYHRINQGEPPPPPKPSDIAIPRTEEGTPIPLLYGRTRVRAPILAWMGNAVAREPTAGQFVYTADMFFVLGIPFRLGTQHIHKMWAGEAALDDSSGTLGGGEVTRTLSELTGNGDEFYISPGAPPAGKGIALVRPTADVAQADVGPYGFVEFLNGRSAQVMYPTPLPSIPTVTPGYPFAGVRMHAAGLDPSVVPAYRGVLSAFLYDADVVNDRSWQIGESPQPGGYSFEVSTYPIGSSSYPTRIGDDCNPVTVLIDLLTGILGKLGLPTTVIDSDSFEEAGDTLYEESNGYSRCIDDIREAGDIINEILEQIDGVLYEDWSEGETGSIKIKLIRGDYTPLDLPHITPANCTAVEGFAATGMADVVNKVRVVFTNRDFSYGEGSATAQNQANIVAQGNRVVEAVLHYPGVHTFENAANIAARELAARSRPLTRCRVIVDRTFLRVNPGDPIRLTWPEYYLSARIYRVVTVDRGSLENGQIVLDLIEDFFYVRRHTLPGGPVTPSFPDFELDAG